MSVDPFLYTMPGLVLTALGLVIASNKNKRDNSRAIVESEARQRERIIALEVKVDVFWKSVAIDAAKILHTPHPENKRRDELLELFVEGVISTEQLRELISILQGIIGEKSRDFGERAAASTLLRAIEVQYQT